MSGTSLDGIDAVLVRLPATELAAGRLQVLAHAAQPFPPALRYALLALNTPGADEIDHAARAAIEHAELSAAAVQSALAQADVAAVQVCAIGSHGQTVRHRPDRGYTVQLNAPALLAERTGIAVVADFRSRDLAAGGQGAPLVPAFHRALFARPGRDIAVLNLGGFANLSLLFGDGRMLGFDTGPANALLDAWAAQHLGEPFDRDGAFAASGRVDAALLAALLADPYFRQPPPKSTGRDHFNLDWLARHLAAQPAIAPVDVQATLAELTAHSVADALRQHQPAVEEVIVCGGGANNRDLLARLTALLPAARWRRSDDHGLPAQQVEAAAFAWLAQQALHGRPGNLPAVTGARGPRVLGAIYPA